MITHLIKTYIVILAQAGNYALSLSKKSADVGSAVLLAIASAFLGSVAVNARATAPGIPEGQSTFRCDVALMLPSRQLTNATRVDISFARRGANIETIRVVDAAGILYPGGNFKIEKKDGVIKFGGVPMPPERPGSWTGVLEKKLIRFNLRSDELPQAVVIGMGVAADKKSGHFGMVWNATNQVSEMPQPLRGSGIGTCDRLVLEQAK